MEKYNLNTVRKDLKIEGNHLALMKYFRNFTVQFELLRKSGVPV